MTSHDLQLDAPPEEDEPLKLRPRVMEEAEMDITPMIDVTFLLLIFFLVAATLANKETVDMPTAVYGTAVPIQGSLYVTVGEAPNKAIEIYLANGKDPEARVAGTPEQQEARIIDYVQAGLRAAPPKEQVVLKADKTVPRREIERVQQAIGKAGSLAIYLAVLEQED